MREPDPKIIVTRLITETRRLLSDTIAATQAADNRARQQGLDWTRRHRLHVLLQAAEESCSTLPDVLVAPWFLAELASTLHVVRTWSGETIWKEIEPSLKDPLHFQHTILKLHLAEHLKENGHDVRVVPRAATKSPDLQVRAIGGTEELLFIECYHPHALGGQPADISETQAEHIVKKTMEKARGQLPNASPGILAVGAYNQPQANIDTLGHLLEKRLRETSRPDLCGIAIVVHRVLLNIDGVNWSFTPTLTVRFLRNPSYFGTVEIDTAVPQHRLSELVTGQVSDASTDELLSEGPGLNSRRKSQPSVGQARERRSPKTRTLKVIAKPPSAARSIIHPSGDDVPPYFVGDGNLDSACGTCGTILTKSEWDMSVRNVVVECPKCHSYNEFPAGDTGYYTIHLSQGGFNFSGPVILRRGASIIGE
jgi:hypothetical protein